MYSNKAGDPLIDTINRTASFNNGGDPFGEIDQVIYLIDNSDDSLPLIDTVSTDPEDEAYQE